MPFGSEARDEGLIVQLYQTCAIAEERAAVQNKQETLAAQQTQIERDSRPLLLSQKRPELTSIEHSLSPGRRVNGPAEHFEVT